MDADLKSHRKVAFLFHAPLPSASLIAVASRTAHSVQACDRNAYRDTATDTIASAGIFSKKAQTSHHLDSYINHINQTLRQQDNKLAQIM